MKTSFWAWISAIFVINQILYFTPSFGLAYYGVLFLLLAMMLLKDRPKVNAASVLYLVCAISILSNDIPAFFSPWLRLVTFVIVSLLAGPMVYHAEFFRYRIDCFWNLLVLMLAVSVLSFAAYLGGFAHYHNLNNYLCGITAHSVLLGFVSGVSTLFALYRLITQKEKPVYVKIGWAIAGVCSLFCMFLSASRSSFFACTAGAAVLFWGIDSRKITRKIIILVLFLAIAGFSFQWWSRLYQPLIEKNKDEIYNLNYDSRISLWHFHWNSFKQHPVIGVGFSASAMDEAANVDRATGRVESGSSWISLLSMTGVAGCMCFLWLLFQLIHNLWKVRKSYLFEVPFLYAMLAYIAIHMCSEGYIFAAGSFLFWALWLLLGTVHAYAMHNDVQKTPQL